MATHVPAPKQEAFCFTVSSPTAGQWEGGQAAFTHETQSRWPNSIKLLLSTLLNTSFLFTYSLASYTVSHHASLNLSFLLSGIVNKLKTLCFFIYDAFKRGKFVSSINLHLQHSAPSCKTPRCITAQKHSSKKKKAWFHHITIKE